MALALYNRVQQTGTANTTVSFTLTGSVTGYQSFAVIGDTNTTYYTATDTSGSWEVGVGTYSTTGPTLTRTTILSSSNSGSAVTFSGTVNVWVDYPAEKAVSTDTLAYPPAIGGTTPSTGTFTTLTAQTENITGTGQNFLTYSNTFTNGVWSLTNATVATTGATTDPLGGSNAFKLTDNTTNGNHSINQTDYVLAQEYVTSSIYAKSAEYSQIQLDMSDTSTGDVLCTFNLSTVSAGAVSAGGSWTNGTAVITSVGNGWYRCSLSASKGAGGANVISNFKIASAGSVSFAGTGTSGIYLYGAQLEAANSVGVPVITTSSTVFNAPNLQLAGNKVLNLDQYGNLAVSPSYPSGALQAQATTSSATGGNARGANAVDWQTSRNAASQVANGQYAVIGGGYRNTSSNFCSVIAGGESNTVSGYSAVLSGGTSATVSGTYAFGGGGYLNTTSGNNSAVVSGYSNTSAGFYNFVGTGYTNSGTSSSAVTTQSGTMNGTTAVTLSGSNASIKVGQLITGTSISNFPHTYVAAISGTSLTLSQNASGSSTNTLNFYTPHGVVVGGGNNQATGSYSFIGGGGDAGTAANRNVASGDWSVVGGGFKNQATGPQCVIVGGSNNSASQTESFVGSGTGNQATGSRSVISGGYVNLANGDYSVVVGGTYGTTRGINGSIVFPSGYAPISTTSGVSQSRLLILARQTTDATATVLATDGGTAGTNNQLILPNNSAYYFKGSIIANVTGAADGAAWSFEGAIMRGANAASTVLIGTPMLNRVAVANGTGASTTWVVALTADTSNGGLAVTVTGVASTTIRWVAKLETTEVTF